MIKYFAFLILTTSSIYGQIQFGESKQSNIGIILDPGASIKEGGLNLGVEIDYVENGLYIHSGIQTFSALSGKYIDWTTAMGVNLKYGYFDNYKIYAGGRLGLINRGGNTYPTAGIECGFDYIFDNGLMIGLRATDDYRSDFEFWGGKAEFRRSGFLKIGFRL